MCRLWYVVRNALSDTSGWYNVLGRRRAVLPQTLYQLDVSARTIVRTYSIYKEAPEDGPLRAETCRADTWVLINHQCNYIVYLVGMYIYEYYKKLYTDLPMSSSCYSYLILVKLEDSRHIFQHTQYQIIWKFGQKEGQKDRHDEANNRFFASLQTSPKIRPVD